MVFFIFRTYYYKLLKAKGEIKLIRLDHNYFLVKFSMVVNKEFVLYKRACSVLDHYLIIREWTPNYSPVNACIDKVAVWVWILACPLEFYNEVYLKKVGLNRED